MPGHRDTDNANTDAVATASGIDDEDAHDREVIRQVLAMSPQARLSSLSAFYELYLVGQKRLGREPLSFDP